MEHPNQWNERVDAWVVAYARWYKVLDDLAQVLSGDGIVLGDLLDGAAFLALGAQVDQYAQGIVGEFGELHDRDLQL